jgi:PAS domain-containing protein
VIISPAGRYLEASPAALELFGVMPVDLHELHAADVGTFVPDAFRDAARESWRVWVESGMTVVRGEREIIRPDGRRTRVRFEVVREPDGVFHESMVELAGKPERRSAFTTLAAVLEAVREAERALSELPKRSRRRRAFKAEVDQLRDAFEQIVRSRMW